MADRTTIEPLALLRALRRVIAFLPRITDADTLEKHPISKTVYTVLILLSEASDNQNRMNELARMHALSLSSMTRVVNRLEAQSLVLRERCSGDARA
ncbi:MarR family winged helix-turn-helix transcriptional regulator [Streptomyces sp. NPDC007856]|uniref:MarR family winged helix-turn-helix transcriptional regulator n=1 Tax=Streptomyces sp. NPDC007856 TaxID=3364781 RepID=UPI0036892864